MSGRRPYVRPMTGWWKKNPFFVEYMIHEGTAIFVAIYGVVLMFGVVSLAQGEAAWNGWLSAMQHPLAIFSHLALLAAMCYHSWTWFKIMPKTMPPVRLRGQRLSANQITGAGLATVAVASIVLILTALGASS